MPDTMDPMYASSSNEVEVTPKCVIGELVLRLQKEVQHDEISKVMLTTDLQTESSFFSFSPVH